VQPNPDFAAAIAQGVNDWTLETWVRPFDCFKGSILIAQQDPIQAVEEIDRLGDDPGMVQVLMCSATESPFGRRFYHPIYEACVRHNLPLALHVGGEGAGMSQRATGVGHPATYFEWYASLPQTYMAHIISMVSEGVFEKFPTLKVVLYEGGIGWIPHMLWRFDKNWKAELAGVPWLRRPPSEAILGHFYSTTYPLERLPAQDLAALCDIVHADRTLLFSSNYPSWEYGDPFAMAEELPAAIQRRVLVDNALALYGDRLLAKNG
jgi:predicted TIM-barrel fold metal-dependent hydrolase